MVVAGVAGPGTVVTGGRVAGATAGAVVPGAAGDVAGAVGGVDVAGALDSAVVEDPAGAVVVGGSVGWAEPSAARVPAEGSDLLPLVDGGRFARVTGSSPIACSGDGCFGVSLGSGLGTTRPAARSTASSTDSSPSQLAAIAAAPRTPSTPSRA